MKTQTLLLMTLLVLMVTRNGSDAYNWQSGSNGKVMWSSDCDFPGNDVGNKAISAEKCGDVCAASCNCDHFTWNNGVCYMKMAVNPAVNYAKGAICGWVATSRPFGHIQYAIRWGLVPIRGVNLGGWLVVENWINSGDALWNGVSSTVSTTRPVAMGGLVGRFPWGAGQKRVPKGKKSAVRRLFLKKRHKKGRRPSFSPEALGATRRA